MAELICGVTLRQDQPPEEKRKKKCYQSIEKCHRLVVLAQ
jgi:hypothetical protein